MSHTTGASDAVGDAVAALRAGRPIMLLDDRTREDEGDLVIAAERADPELVNLLISEGRGLLCVAAAPSVIDRLDLPQMVRDNSDRHGTAFTVSVDATGTGTGISAADRAATIRALADPETRPGDLRRPGHVFPLRAVAGGVLERRGHTEASVELVAMAGLVPAAAICEVLDGEGAAADRAHLTALAHRLDIPILDVGAVAAAVARRSDAAEALLPNRYGIWRTVGHRAADGTEHLALVLGDPSTVEAPPVRVHSECLTGDVLGSWRCDCGEQLDLAMATIARAGAGAVIYLRGQEGRGIGLVDKIRAYALQDGGCDTVEANVRLGLPVDARDFAPAAELLRRLGIPTVRLLTNNPSKALALQRNGITVHELVAVQARPRPENRRYLETKRRRLGHRLVAGDLT
ncbi:MULTISPECIES: bifunctional 3,4-dihydroxy-2-butanone-4-phosphate synthase/GTP cyclohydrolase II [unclassified Amycolatopsis]|uniref:bifunctional 3,4-dihydroxy-2-butanone-4-phosphate synthase/GTP cyclohydrolase II n=1 Tax=unclassified Amycolatopsis TaxID=2618356 RepID=UPI00026288EA|nr:bifunctional 3,4-dihydroxy-2-butanone-4-phosphate synthase/GTP cyclohydrolase II [Amycolatopsis sp. ATCC 39116]